MTTLRTRLIATFAGVFVVSMAAVLMVSYLLVSQQVRGTLPARLADPILSQLVWKYVLALVGATLLSIALGFLAAQRILAPIQAITATAQPRPSTFAPTRASAAGKAPRCSSALRTYP